MNINREVICKLLKLLDQGLKSGSGSFDGPGDFCVQQAVSKAIGEPNPSDYPVLCVNDHVKAFGIRLNDQLWSSPAARAKGLKRFAVAELGTTNRKAGDRAFGEEFERLLCNKWNRKHGTTYTHAHQLPSVCDDSQLEELANTAADVLTKMGSIGSQFLYMCEPGAKLTPKHQKQYDDSKRMFAPQLTWRNYGGAKGAQKGAASHIS
jgi:hypothetical protein